ncbi:MAG: cytidyltransferase-related domain protein [Oscillospiraceae bacterium]|nr:cytidyltransferase-related domain protein [Oscillospiraceae bacterium]
MKQKLPQFAARWHEAFQEESLLRRLHDRGDAAQWAASSFYLQFLPVEHRLTCVEVLRAAEPLFAGIPEPEGGWPTFVLNTAVAGIYPNRAVPTLPAQQDAARCALCALQQLLTEERTVLPFDRRLDFDFIKPEALKGDPHAAEYRRFLRIWKTDCVYEMLRLSGELTPFRTLPHIAGVHLIALQTAKELKEAGGPVDISLVSAAAAGHDIGKFGCMPEERVPYLHYYYTDRWFESRGLPAVGQIAANHSTWDLELENMSAESMLLIYADFRVKQQSGDGETAIYSLDDAFDVILHKLDNVDGDKRRRYEYVYHKLHDFELYLQSKGVDVTLSGKRTEPWIRKNIALLNPEETDQVFRLMAVGHNLSMMHQFGQERLFAEMLEAARSEKDWTKVRTYLSIFEEYFTYLSAGQKTQTLQFLYELLLSREGDIRRQAATLMGRILARFNLRYKKEIPASEDQDRLDQTQFNLWVKYLNLLLYPDRKLTPQQKSHIHFITKMVVAAVLEQCGKSDVPRFLRVLMSYYREDEDEGAALALTDTLLYLPLRALEPDDLRTALSFAARQLCRDNLSLQIAALRFFCSAADTLPRDHEAYEQVRLALGDHRESSIPALRYLWGYFRQRVSGDSAWDQSDIPVADIFVDNLKTATPWMLKIVNVELLAAHAERGGQEQLLHVAAHFSNLIKASETIVVRYAAAQALLTIAPHLTYDQRNEVAVELSKGLEVGRYEFSKYIPQCLGEFSLFLRPMELDEILASMQLLMSHGNDSVVVGALDTVGVMLEHYGDYGDRYPERLEVWEARRRKMTGILLKGIASYRETVQQEAMFLFGETLFHSEVFAEEEKAWLFQRCAHKLLFLLHENQSEGLNYPYCSAALYHIYRFLVHYEVDHGSIQFRGRRKIAFFPGTFDPFTLSHKGIVRAIRDLGFEVYLALDEFSWSKKTQPSLIRRQIVSMSVADEFHVYLFPPDIPVNIANPSDLRRLKSLFPDCEIYLTVGSDVVRGASAYRAPVTEDSVHTMNHIVFRRVSDLHGDGGGGPALGVIQGDVIELQLPSQMEDISSTRIRENIDLDRDISNLIDPVVQEYIYQRGLYLREPQYKPVMEAGSLRFEQEDWPTEDLLLEALESVPERRRRAVAAEILRRGDRVQLLRDAGRKNRVVAAASLQNVRQADLYPLLQNMEQVNRVRDLAAGRLLLVTGLYGDDEEAQQYLLTELFTAAMERECSFALFADLEGCLSPLSRITLGCQGFVPVGGEESLLLVDMNSPVVFLQNAETAIKAPFSGDTAVLETIRLSRRKLKMALVSMYPGKLILSISSSLLHHRLVQKITELNGVPMTPASPRALGPCMCVPFGKLLRGHAVPNTVTKTIHTDKVFTPDIRNHSIAAFPFYAPLEDQMRTVKSFRRPVILVDDLLHSGRRIRVLEPLARKEGVEVREVLVGILSGQGKDLMEQWGRTVDQIYFVPNLRAWYVESTLYPFIGGDTVQHDRLPESGLRPSVNLILPYTCPAHLKTCGPEPFYRFSQTCLRNTWEIVTTLEASYRKRFARNLTLARLSEVIVLPLCPDKGSLQYDQSLAVSAYLENDLAALQRMENLFL